MRKNLAGQVVGAQMLSAADGSAFTGAVTVYVTKDGGTQAIGSVGSGLCTHEGNGFHTYAPAQAETDADHVAFTFIGTGAVPATVQLYTRVGADIEAIDGDAGAAQKASDNAKGAVKFVVDTGATTISVPTSSLSPAASVADQFKNKVLTFADDTTTAALRGQSCMVSASTSGGVLTVTPLTTAPVSGDYGVIT